MKCYCCDDEATTTARVSDDKDDMYGEEVNVCERCKYNIEERDERL